jgi:FkbM family methyltransferase
VKSAAGLLCALLPAALSFGVAVLPITAFAQEPALETPLASEPLYSQGREESIVRDFFRDGTNGFFVDVGAAWPIENSNTYYLENHLGWTGIAIDALPEYGPSWAVSRPRSRFYSFFVTDHSDTTETFYRSALTGVSSYQKEQAQGPSGDVAFEEMQVPSITLNSLLEKNGVTRVDFLSMDIEGAELMALAGFDIDRFRPDLVCIEAKPANRQGLLDYFAGHGYQRIERYVAYDETNYYFEPKEALVHDPYHEPPPIAQGGSLDLLARSALALALAHVLPGILLAGILGLDGGPLKRWTFAAVLGGPLAAAIYLASLVSGSPLLYWVTLGVVDLAAVGLFVRDRRLYRPDARGGTKVFVGLLALLLALSSAYLYTTGRFFQIDREGRFSMDPAFTEDALFHAGLVESLQTAYPARLLSVSGARAYPYHVGYHLQVAAWERFFGVDRYDGIYRVGILWSLALLVFAAYSFALRFGKGPPAALGATALLFGGGLGFLFHASAATNWWSLVFMDAALVSIFLVNPLLPALPLLFVALGCLDDYLQTSNRGALAGAAFAMVALVAVKEVLAVQALAALVIAAALARGTGAPRVWRAVVALTLASAPMLLWSALAFREANERLSLRPLEIVRYSMETLGRQRWVEALAAIGDGHGSAGDLGLGLISVALWLAGFLGLRLLAARSVVRDSISRSGSLRSCLAWFVLIGFPLTLLLRIAPADVDDLSRKEALNESFWFATFSGVLMWLWTADVLSALGRGGQRARALVWTGAFLLAFPATVQHFVYKTSLSADAPSVPPSGVAAAMAGRAVSQPEEIFVEPLRRVRPSLPAYLAGRPVVYESFVAYDDPWVALRELEYRRHATAQFWSSPDPGYGTWFLSHFGVRWIFTPRDVLSPRAGARWATPVFANDAATIYRVGELPGVALEVPRSLPLGTRGASFFGEGWGPPQSSRHSRRLAPGAAVLYIPTNDAQPLRLGFRLETPHVNGTLTLGSGQANVGSDQDVVELILAASESNRGLSRLELLWQGAEPLVVTGVSVEPGSF